MVLHLELSLICGTACGIANKNKFKVTMGLLIVIIQCNCHFEGKETWNKETLSKVMLLLNLTARGTTVPSHHRTLSVHYTSVSSASFRIQSICETGNHLFI